MVDATPEDEPQPVDPVTDRLDRVARLVVAGHPQGMVRRILLYVIVSLGLAAAASASGPYTVICMVVMVALVLLAMTDQLA